MKKLLSIIALTYKHYQSMRMTGEAKLSEMGAEESELFAPAISIEESKEEKKPLRLSSELAELVVDSEEDKQISGNDEEVEKKVVEIDSAKDAGGKKVKLGKKAEHEQGLTDAACSFLNNSR